METWIWISLYIIQTLVGSVLWRKIVFTKQLSYSININLLSFFFSAILVPNISMIFAYLFDWLNYIEKG